MTKADEITSDRETSISITNLYKPLLMAEAFIRTESSWLYPVYERITTIELIPKTNDSHFVIDGT